MKNSIIVICFILAVAKGFEIPISHVTLNYIDMVKDKKVHYFHYFLIIKE